MVFLDVIGCLQLLVLICLVLVVTPEQSGVRASAEARICVMRDATIEALQAAADQADRFGA